jgi:hypothetical protein
MNSTQVSVALIGNGLYLLWAVVLCGLYGCVECMLSGNSV